MSSYPYKEEVLATKYAYIPDDAANAPARKQKKTVKRLIISMIMVRVSLLTIMINMLANGLMLIGTFALFAAVSAILLTTRELSKRLSRMSIPVGSVLQLLLDIMMNLKSLPNGRRAGIQ